MPKSGYNFYLRIASIVLLLLTFPYSVTAAEPPKHEPQLIVIGGDRDYPPYEYLDKDGHPNGYNVELTRAIAESVHIPVIASGGAGTLESLYEVLDKGKASAVLAASIFHYGTYTIGQTKEFLSSRGVPVRPV